MPARKYIIARVGHTFGRWLVLRYSHSEKIKRITYDYWLCRCSCGTERPVAAPSLIAGKSRSCGCLQKETAATLLTTHGTFQSGQKKTSEYIAWQHMLGRCLNPTIPEYRNYGARGISICVRWRSSFKHFLDDMGLKPSPKHSLERINNNGNYEPANCKWDTRHNQQRNKRTNR